MQMNGLGLLVEGGRYIPPNTAPFLVPVVSPNQPPLPSVPAIVPTAPQSLNPAYVAAHTLPKPYLCGQPNPFPAGSEYAAIWDIWDGYPGSTLGHLTLSNGVDIAGWRANCTSTTNGPTGNGGYEMTHNAGSSITAGYAYPYQLSGISNPSLTQEYVPAVAYVNGQPHLTGGITGLSTGGQGLNAFGQVVVAFLSVATGAVVGAAVAGAGAVAAGTGTATTAGATGGVATTGGDATVLLPDASSVVVGDSSGALATTGTDATGLLPDTSSLPGAPTIDSSGALSADGGVGTPGTAGNPMELPSDLTPNYIPPAPVDSVTALTSSDIAAMAPTEQSISDLIASALPDPASLLPSAGSSLPSAGSSALPTAGQAVSIGRAIAGLIGGGAAAGLIPGIHPGMGTGTIQGGIGAPTTSAGSIGVILAAGLAAIYFMRKGK